MALKSVVRIEHGKVLGSSGGSGTADYIFDTYEEMIAALDTVPEGASIYVKDNTDGQYMTSPFKFGIDEDGNYGYYKAGADTVTPFKTELPDIFADGWLLGVSKGGFLPSNSQASATKKGEIYYLDSDAYNNGNTGTYQGQSYMRKTGVSFKDARRLYVFGTSQNNTNAGLTNNLTIYIDGDTVFSMGVSTTSTLTFVAKIDLSSFDDGNEHTIQISGGQPNIYSPYSELRWNYTRIYSILLW